MPEMSVSSANGLRMDSELDQGRTDPFNFTPVANGQPALDIRKALPVVGGAASSPTYTAAPFHTAAQHREDAKAKRRVPASQRKRTKLSCDACKARRCKCLRTGTTPHSEDGNEDHALAPCKNCLDAGINCITTLPRKQRIYGSVENLDRRYRVLDALVSGLCPQLGQDATAEEIVAFGKRSGLDMPDIGSEHENRASPSPLSIMVSPVEPLAADHKIGDDRSESDESGVNFFKDTSGRSHYIGPSGSLATFAVIRDLVARRLQASSDPEVRSRVNHVSSRSVTDTITSSFTEIPESVSAWSGDVPERALGDLISANRDTKPKRPSNNGVSRFWIPIDKIKLPTRDIADACVQGFFENVHPDFMVLHQAAFQESYAQLWKSSPRRQSISSASSQQGNFVAAGWLCCLYMVFILGSRSLTSRDSNSLDFQRTYYDMAKELPSMLIGSTLPNISAFLLLTLYSHNINDRTGSWAYLGLASRLAISLGMHRKDADMDTDPVHRELRKRVWWTLYEYEQHLCCSLGRPSAIDDPEVNADAANEAVLEPDTSLPPEYMTSFVRLMRLLGRVRKYVHEPMSSAINLLPQAIELLGALAVWERDLPLTLTLRRTPPFQSREASKIWRRVVLLHLQHQKTLNLLTRRFLLEEIESIDRGQDLRTNTFIITALGRICVTSAMRTVDMLVDLWTAGQFNGITWLDTYYAYLASLQLCLRLLEPSSLARKRDDTHQNMGAWSFRPHELQMNEPSVQPYSSLDHEVDALIAQSRLVENHSAAEVTDAVRKIHDMLETVEMCGFSVQCNIIATEFAKAVGAIDGRPLSTLFGGKLGQEMDKIGHNPATKKGNQYNFHAPYLSNLQNTDDLASSNARQLRGQQVRQALDPARHANPYAPQNALQPELDFDYVGVLNTNHLANMPVTHPPVVHWDMVLQPGQWEEPNYMLHDMTNMWSWPSYQGEGPYDMPLPQ